MCRAQGGHYNPLFPKKKNVINNTSLFIGNKIMQKTDLPVEDMQEEIISIGGGVVDNFTLGDIKSSYQYKIYDHVHDDSTDDSLLEAHSLFTNWLTEGASSGDLGGQSCSEFYKAQCANNSPKKLCNFICCRGIQDVHRASQTSIPTLYLRRFRDPYLCPNSHTLGDFCLEVGRPRVLSGSGGAGDTHDNINALCLGVDSGSSICLISNRAHKILLEAGFAEARINLSAMGSSDVEINVLDGSILAVGYCKIKFPFWFGDPAKDVATEFYILRNDDLPCCILLGGDFLRKLDITVVCDDNAYLTSPLETLTLKSHKGYEFSIKPMQREIENIQNRLNTVACSWLYSYAYVCPPWEETLELREEQYPFFLSEVDMLQGADDEINQLKFAVTRKSIDKCPSNLKPIFKNFGVRSSILVYEHPNKAPVPVIGRNFLITLATQIHSSYNHIGRAKLILLLQKFCWSPSMQSLVGGITTCCPLCQVNKADTGKLAPPVLCREVLNPYDLVCLDILTLPKTKRGHVGLLVISDHASKWIQAVPIKNHSSSTLISCLKGYIAASVKCPRTILSDNEASLVSEEFKEFCTDYDINRIYSAPYQSHVNGFSEKNCGLISKQLRFFSESNTDWDLLMSQVVMKHNFSISTTTGVTPSSFILERAHIIDADNILPAKTESVWKMGNPNFEPYKKGTKVLHKIKYAGNRAVDKLKPRFEGIYKVIKINGNGLSYVICDLVDKEKIKRNIHYSDLKLYYFPAKSIRYNKVFAEHYMEWQKLAFQLEEGDIHEAAVVEQDEYFTAEIPGISCQVTTDVDPFWGVSCAGPSGPNRLPPREDAESSESSDDDLEHQNAVIEEYKIAKYVEYEHLWNLGISNNLTNVPKLSFEVFIPDYKQDIPSLEHTFGGLSVFQQPCYGGRHLNSDLTDQIIPLANRLMECCRTNTPLDTANFHVVNALYIGEERDRFRELYALAMNYIARWVLDNIVNNSLLAVSSHCQAHVGPKSDTGNSMRCNDKSNNQNNNENLITKQINKSSNSTQPTSVITDSQVNQSRASDAENVILENNEIENTVNE